MFKSSETLRTLVESTSPFIPVVYSQEMERELATAYRRLHCIAVRPRNAVDSKPDIELRRLNHDSFRKGLSAMGIEDDRARLLVRESGLSPTILRRRLSKIDAIRTPQWSADEGIARSLIPIALVGTWHSKSNADREVVSTLSDRPYEDTERDIARFLQLDDCPVWSVGQYRGVVSKIDALFAISKDLIARDLEDFFFLAKYVLSETDPGLELHEESRRTAGFHGKVRDHSIALRDGICETLVILSIHGNDLFQERIGMDIERSVSSLIRGILTALTVDKLQSHDRDLPNFAEASPNEFLAIIEEDLEKSQPIVFRLLKPVEPGAFNSPTRTGLLWALECLAWKHLGRVSLILAQLSRIAIEDSLHNRPIFSLRAAFSSWVPQTSASLAERMKALDMLCSRFPEIGWQICIEESGTGSLIGQHSYRPRWRSDASNAGCPVSTADSYAFTRKAMEFVLAWPNHNHETLSELAERLPSLSVVEHNLVWDLIEAWVDSESNDSARALFRERIRGVFFSRRAIRNSLSRKTKDRAQMVYEKLQPCDPVVRHGWLFIQDWVEPSEFGIEEEDFDYIQHEKRVRRLRTDAMKEIWAIREFEGVIGLVSRSEAPQTVGGSLYGVLTSINARTNFLRRCLSITDELKTKFDGCMQGFLACVDNASLCALLSAVESVIDARDIARLFRCAPFRRDIWRLLDKYNAETRDSYWQRVLPHQGRYATDELTVVIDRLLNARRPRTAFRAVQRHWDQVETSRLKRLLLAVSSQDAETADTYRVQPDRISEALASLDGRTGVSVDELAQLEFLFLDSLMYNKRGIPNLEQRIAESPPLFVSALALAYKRRDDGQVPLDWRFGYNIQIANLQKSARSLLGRIGRIPGAGPDGKIDSEMLLNWVVEARRHYIEQGLVELGDQSVGELLSRSPAEEGGGWPCIPVCAAMERIATRHLGIGFENGYFNRRGVIRKEIDEGGDEERQLAARFRAWAQQRAFDYPYVRNVLDRIAADFYQQAIMEDEEAEVRSRLEF